jgi:hypothetical protein
MLQNRALECLSRLREAETAKDGVDEAAQLNLLHSELARATTPFCTACAKAIVMSKAGVPISLSSTIAKDRQVIDNVATRFREKPEAATLKQGKRWRSLLEATSELASSLDSSLGASWKNYIGSKLFVGRPPDEEERSLAKTPANQKALQRYRTLFTQFAQMRSSPPTAAETFARLRDLSEELSSIKFERNVPRAIQDFLEATGSPAGATLDHLTDEVKVWLEEHDVLESYVIKPRVS